MTRLKLALQELTASWTDAILCFGAATCRSHCRRTSGTAGAEAWLAAVVDFLGISVSNGVLFQRSVDLTGTRCARTVAANEDLASASFSVFQLRYGIRSDLDARLNAFKAATSGVIVLGDGDHGRTIDNVPASVPSSSEASTAASNWFECSICHCTMETRWALTEHVFFNHWVRWEIPPKHSPARPPGST